jgi:lysophospholipid acyltransferase
VFMLFFCGYCPKWDKLRQVDVIAFEFASSGKLAASSWNISVHLWIKNCKIKLTKDIFLRPLKNHQKAGSIELVFSFFIIAIWHGFYPGYYIFFLLAGLGLVACQQLRYIFLPVMWGGKKTELVWPEHLYHPKIMTYKLFGWFFTQWSACYLGCS